MNLIMAQYIEINAIGIVMLLTMLFYIVRMHPDDDGCSQMFFIKLLECNVAILLSDILIYLMRWHNAPVFMVMNHGACMVYFLLHSYFGYLWLGYTVKRLYPEYEPGKKIKAIILLPFILSSIFVIASPWTKWVYILTSQNRYMRGPYMWGDVALSYLYWAVSAGLVLYEMLKQRRNREEALYATLLFFPIPTLIGNLVQLKYYGLSIVWVCSAISLLILFIDIQNNQLCCDMLTGLYNRRQTNKNINWEIKQLVDADYLLFVMMIDVDHFKKINDEFGHVVGDDALRAVSMVLKEASRKDDFIGRFGGDEFIIMGHANNHEEIRLLINDIHKLVDNYNNESHCFYTLSLSAGYETYSRNDQLSVDKVISAADKEMYKVKVERNGE